jgi:hypothetical protein
MDAWYIKQMVKLAIAISPDWYTRAIMDALMPALGDGAVILGKLPNLTHHGNKYIWIGPARACTST